VTRGCVKTPVPSVNLAAITVATAIIIVWAWTVTTVIPSATTPIVGRAIAATTTAYQRAILVGDVAATTAEAQPGSLPTPISTTATGFQAVAQGPHIPTRIEVRAPRRTPIALRHRWRCGQAERDGGAGQNGFQHLSHFPLLLSLPLKQSIYLSDPRFFRRHLAPDYAISRTTSSIGGGNDLLRIEGGKIAE